ncbi:galactokinase [Metabacillus iocasae]|uniref:Galactokinase n=1 Tax=Priestia iocasae TaxID=2291674 RepID=A0ABS2QUG1_9BACI|nr:galactokinase [Metabacillus iocasae]MBM7703079.1 galactokinase [Metabacillus iocasae]
MNYRELARIFVEKFQYDDYRVFFAPGRINLIGEHTDYNGGHVFPCAITFGTTALARKRDDDRIRMYSVNFPEKGVIEFSLNDLQYRKEHDWTNYPKGMLAYLKAQGHSITNGLDVVYHGTIPNGAGLSSSASIELVTGILLESLFQLHLERLDLVKIGKQVENEFIGVNSGIMDQFAIGMGKEHHAILLDCQTLQYEYAPMNVDDHSIVIMNTNKRRELADSKYNERRSECEAALHELQAVVNIEALGELTEEQFESHKHVITNDTWEKRAKHAVYESRRTLKAIEALKRHDLYHFGELMNASHRSLRDDYEVTGVELDTLVEVAWKQQGVVGARMTGAGFGGCAIAIVDKLYVKEFIEKVGAEYQERIGYDATFYEASIGDGARELKREAMVG